MQALGRQPQRAPDGSPVHCERHRTEPTTLYRLPFGIQVRALLDHEGLACTRVPAFSPARLDVVPRRIGKFPALDTDGQLHVDSTDIAHALERLVPKPRVLLAEPAQRALKDALEDGCDEAL